MNYNILFIRKFIVSDINSIVNFINNKRHLLLFVKMETLLYFIQYEYADFPCVLQPETISYAKRSLIAYIKVVFI